MRNIPRSGFHHRVARWVGKNVGLKGLESGSMYPDQIAMKKMEKLSIDDYGVSWNYPHHKGNSAVIKKLMEGLREEKLENGRVSPFFLGALTHLIADKWCPDSRASNFTTFENKLENIRFDSDFRTGSERASKIMDAKILNKIPNDFPFQKWFGDKPSLKEAAKCAYRESLTAGKSIMADEAPTEACYRSYKKAENSIEEHSILRKLYWLFDYLHPFGWLTAILQHKAIREDDEVLRYARAKNGIGKSIGGAIFGLFLTLVSPIFLLSVLSFVGQTMLSRIEIDESVKKNVDWYNWNAQRKGSIEEVPEKCPECSAELEPGAKFCIECGSEVVEGKRDRLDGERPEGPVEKCPKCGTILEPNSNFCIGCGAKLAVEEKGAVGEEFMKKTEEICPVCGAILEPDAKFCVECGTEVVAGKIEVKPEEITGKKSSETEEEKVYNCETCGKRISKEEYEKNGGQCVNCVIEDSGIAMIYK